MLCGKFLGYMEESRLFVKEWAIRRNMGCVEEIRLCRSVWAVLICVGYVE